MAQQQWMERPRPRTKETAILRDLIGVGVYANSVWDLVETAAPIGRARRVLEAHLAQGGYDEHVMLGLGLALERARSARLD